MPHFREVQTWLKCWLLLVAVPSPAWMLIAAETNAPSGHITRQKQIHVAPVH